MCGLSLYPDLSDRALGRTLDINSSTISTIKQRLKEEKIFEKVSFPNFFGLKDYLPEIRFGTFRYPFHRDIYDTVFNISIQTMKPVFNIRDPRSWLTLGVRRSADSTDAGDRMSLISNEIIHNMNSRIEIVNCHPSIGILEGFFDYSGLLSQEFEFNGAQPRIVEFSRWSFQELREKEKHVLESVIKNPWASDYKRSMMLGISHPTFKKTHSGLKERGIIMPLIIPNLLKFGYTVLSWSHISLEGRNVDRRDLDDIARKRNNIFCIRNRENLFLIEFYKSLAECSQCTEGIHSFLSSSRLSLENMSTGVFSMDSENTTSYMDTAFSFDDIYAHYTSAGRPEIIVRDNETLLLEILSRSFGEKPGGDMLKAVRESVGQRPEEPVSPQDAEEIILEILTETSHMKGLEPEEKIATQASLVEMLNTLKVGRDSGMRETGTGGPHSKREMMMAIESRQSRYTMHDILSRDGFDVTLTCDNGGELIDGYGAALKGGRRPAFVMLNISLKGIDGIEAIKKIRSMDPEARILVLTSSSNRKMRTKMLSLGVDQYLVKPVTREQLMGSIRSIVNNRQE